MSSKSKFNFTQDTFHIPSPQPASSSHQYHIIFLPGNPGCIGYYRAYLAHLASLLNAPTTTTGVSVFGTSYANFSGERSGPVLDLPQQIEFTEAVIGRYVASVRGGGRGGDAKKGSSPVRVILVGHSLGSYIGLEVTQRWRERERVRRRVRGGEGGGEGEGEGEGGMGVDGDGDGMEIVGCVGVWATPTWLSMSTGGRRAWPLCYLPFGVQIVSFVARFLGTIIPAPLFFRLVQYVTKFPDDATSTTASFLKSPLGVRESLTMVLDELRDIGPDKWSADIWGTDTPAPGPPPTQVVLYFGNKDHYVNPVMRDQLIYRRGRGPGKQETWRPIMEVDQSEVPHSFCIRDSKYAAEKTAGYILGIIDGITK